MANAEQQGPDEQGRIWCPITRTFRQETAEEKELREAAEKGFGDGCKMPETTLEEKIKEKKKQIETIDSIASRCSTDGQARAYEENRREKVRELVELEKQLKSQKDK